MYKTDRLLGLGIVLFCLILWFLIIPQQTSHRRAAEFPRMVVVFMALPALVLAIKPTLPASERVTWGMAEKRAMGRSVILLGLTALYMGLVPVVGFYICSTISLLAFLRCLGEKRWRYLFILPLCVMTILYLTIAKMLSFPMPTGRFF